MVDKVAYHANEKYVFERARMFIETEEFLSAPKSAYTICYAVTKTLEAKNFKKKLNVFNVSEHCFRDISGYCKVLKLK